MADDGKPTPAERRAAVGALAQAAGERPCAEVNLVGPHHRPGFLVRGSWSLIYNGHGDGVVVFAPGNGGTKLGLAWILHAQAVRSVMCLVRDSAGLHDYVGFGWKHAEYAARLAFSPEAVGEGRERLTLRKVLKIALAAMSLLQDDSSDSYYLDEQVAWVLGFFLRTLELLRPDVIDVRAWIDEQCESTAGRRAPKIESMQELDLPAAMEHMLETGQPGHTLLPKKPSRQAPPRPASSSLLQAPPPSPRAAPAPGPARP